MIVGILVGVAVYVFTGNAVAAWIVGIVAAGIAHPASRR